MGKKWKKNNKRVKEAADDEEFASIPDSSCRQPVHERLGWNKQSKNKKWKKKSDRKNENSFKKALELNGGDIDMGSTQNISGSKHNPRGTESNVANTGWHRVTLSQAAKYPKVSVLQTLAQSLSLRSLTLEPIAFKEQGPHFHFYVESASVASALKALDKQLNMSPTDPFVLRIKVTTSPPPQMVMTDDVLASLKMVMSQRYDVTTGCLNLSRFHYDPAFLGHDVYVPLSRTSVMSNVIKIINANVPQVLAIDLSQNKLPTLDYFSTLETLHLKSLNLDDNRIELRQLEKLKSLRLVELSVQKNPLMRGCNIDVNKKEDVVNKIRTILPTLQILNGSPLPKKLSFGGEDEVLDNGANVLPLSVKKLATSDIIVNEMVLRFLHEFFTIYDSDKRDDLLQAYHEHAYFSMSSAYPPGTTAHGVMKLQEYQLDSRNLKLVQKKAKRDKLLKQDRLSVVAFLTKLPPTSHDLNTFTLDIPFASEGLLTFIVTGIFKERSSSCPVRYFNRKFIVARGSNNTLLIVNDILFVTIPTPEQSKTLEAPTVYVGSAPSLRVTSMSDITSMVTALSSATRMNLAFSRKCLEDTNWDYNIALAAFKTAFEANQIPPEAFI